LPLFRDMALLVRVTGNTHQRRAETRPAITTRAMGPTSNKPATEDARDRLIADNWLEVRPPVMPAAGVGWRGRWSPISVAMVTEVAALPRPVARRWPITAVAIARRAPMTGLRGSRCSERACH
jgi:hypothetical protein